MKPAPSRRLPALEEAIWRTVAYVDLFDYPLTPGEIHRYLEGMAASPTDVARALAASPELAETLSFFGGYFCLPGREEIVGIRQERQRRAQALWPQAVRYGRLMARLPFVRLVAVTGSLAMNNVTEQADVDFFIVTENGRLWLARALIIGIVRVAGQKGVTLCPNYFVSEAALRLPERNLYTAREIAQMVPLFGQEVYASLRRQNCWVSQFLPNAAGPPTVRLSLNEPDRWPQKVSELILRPPLGTWLEHWEQSRKIERLRRQQNGSPESYFSAVICKGHFQAHQQRTLTAFQDRLKNCVNQEPHV